MCFSPPLSAFVGVSALTAAALLKRRGRPLRCYSLFVFFGLMEFLQLAQYAVADQCSNPVNQALTWLAYVHVAFQPLVVNLYFLWGQRNPHPEVGTFVLRMCVASALWMLMRTPLLPLAKLGDALHTVFPDLPTSDMYGQHCGLHEAFCGPRTCSFIGGAWSHISWELPLAPTTYLLPSASLHGFMFFVPTLVAGDGVKRALMAATVLIGPLACMQIAARDMATYRFEWATIWCFFAAIQAVWAVLAELWLFGQSWAPASAAEMAAAGKWRAPAAPLQQKQQQQKQAAGRGAQPLLLDSPSDRAALDDGGVDAGHHSKAQ